jgi:hypothetical protein
MRLAGSMWTSPNTLLGLLAALLGGGKFYGVRGGALVFVPRTWGFWAWFFQSWGGITIGECVFVRDGENASVLAHELRHVWQYRCLGPLFLPAYGLASVWAWLSGRHYYNEQFFEVDAQRHS